MSRYLVPINPSAMRQLALAIFLIPALALGQAQYDARILGYEGLGQVCQGMVQPRLKIMNQGTAVMTSCVVETWKNGFIDNSFNWELAVGAVQDEVRQPTFPAVEVSHGDLLEFHIVSVNTVADEVAEGNDLSVTITDDAIELVTATVLLELGSGPMCGPITWSMHDASGASIQAGDVAAGATAEVWVTLATNACHEFRVRLAEGGAIGDCQVRIHGEGELVHEVTELTDWEARVGLHTGASVGTKEEEPVRPVAYPVPTRDQLHLVGLRTSGTVLSSIMDATGRVLRAATSTTSGDRMTIDTRGLAPGHYFLRLQAPDLTLTPIAFVLE